MTERERHWWRPGSDTIDTVAEHHDGSLTSHHPKGHGPVELAESGATVNAVCPVGAADAGMGREVLELKVLATGTGGQVEVGMHLTVGVLTSRNLAR